MSPIRGALELLLKPPPEGAGLDVSAGNHRALRSAAAAGDVQTVCYLADVWGADVRARDNEALRMAALRGDAVVVEALLHRRVQGMPHVGGTQRLQMGLSTRVDKMPATHQCSLLCQSECLFSFDRGANAFACHGEDLVVNIAEVTKLLQERRSKALMSTQGIKSALESPVRG